MSKATTPEQWAWEQYHSKMYRRLCIEEGRRMNQHQSIIPPWLYDLAKAHSLTHKMSFNDAWKLLEENFIETGLWGIDNPMSFDEWKKRWINDRNEGEPDASASQD